MVNETPDKWIAGDAYEHFMGRWSRLVAKEFISWLAPPLPGAGLRLAVHRRAHTSHLP